jgi:uncharacterized repeat protein (TIGR01451 family)
MSFGKYYSLGAGVLLMTFIMGPALAQPAIGTDVGGAPAVGAPKTVAVILTQFKLFTAADGTEQWQDATSVKPGDVVEYRATYTNNTGRAVTGLVADLPIPEGLEYLPKSAKPGALLVTAAARDGVFAAEPLTRNVGGNLTGKTEPVAYADYRSLRWTLGRLPASGVTAVSARAKVQIVVPPAPKVAAAPQPAPLALQAAIGTPSR